MLRVRAPPILEGLGDVGGGDRVLAGELGERAVKLEYAVVSASGEAEQLHRRRPIMTDPSRQAPRRQPL